MLVSFCTKCAQRSALHFAALQEFVQASEKRFSEEWTQGIPECVFKQMVGGQSALEEAVKKGEVTVTSEGDARYTQWMLKPW